MIVYADNAATTKIRQEVLDAVSACDDNYGNPSSLHSMGQNARELIENARKKVAKSIGAKPNEIIFTSSGTESNNLAIQGYVNANGNRRRNHIITTSIEHISVLNPIWHLYDKGCEITLLPVDGEGNINIHQLQNSIRRNTVLISVMFANNEIGTIHPIKEIGKIARQYGICFHTDAVSAFGYCDIDVDKYGIDMMSISGHKIYAPKGMGALYVKDGIELFPLFYGGGQEYGLRSGTENVSAIVGMGKAVELLEDTEAHMSMLRDRFLNGVFSKIQKVVFNGSAKNSLCSIVNLSFEGVDAKALLMDLDTNGIYASTGCACMSDSLRPSHVLRAIGVPDTLARSSIRFSFGRYNSEADIDYILDVLPDLVDKLRRDA